MSSNKSITERFLEKIAFCNHGYNCDKCCWPWTASRTRGEYGQFHLEYDEYNKQIMIKAHVFMYIYFIESLSIDKPYVCHTCDNPPCCNFWHLFSGNNSDNMKDMFYKHRRSLQGSMNNNAKLQEFEIHLIHQLRNQGLLQREIMNYVPTTRENIRDILNGRRWYYIWEQYHG